MNEPQIETDASLQLVTFHVGNVRFGIEIAFVQEINQQLAVTRVPESHEIILGVVNLRGDVVTVLDPHQIFDIRERETGGDQRNLILNFDGERVGLLVDGVSEILTVQESRLSVRPGNVQGVERNFVRAVYLQDKDVVVVLDSAAMLESIDQTVGTVMTHG